MSVWVDPNLLSLVGLGLMDDPDVPDGRHLRWFFGRYVGFPRSGFWLTRHPSLANAAWDSPTPDPLLRTQLTGQAEVGLGLTRRFPSGLTVSKAGGFTYQAVGTSSVPMRVDTQPVTLDLGPEGPGPSFPPGPMLSNPAAFVRLTIVRRKDTGHATATAYYNAQPELRYQDSGHVGPIVAGWLPPHLNDAVLESALGWRVRSSAERLLPAESLTERDRKVAATVLRPMLGLGPTVADPNPWVTQTILLRGSFLERVVVTGSDAALSRAQWVTVRQYAAAPQWDPVDTFHLPLTDDPGIYPQWSPLSGEEVAFNRLQVAPPNRNLPWDDKSAAVETNLKVRYLQETFKDMDDAMRLFLKGEIAESIPQAEVQVVQELEEDPPSEEPETVLSAVRPLDHLYAAASDPQVARILGLMTTDLTDKSGVYDYMVQCSVPQPWVQRSLAPSEAVRRALFPRAESRDDMLIAMATGIVRERSLPPEAPPDLQPLPEPDLNAGPMPARVELSWKYDPRGVFENGAATRVFYELRRQGPTGSELLHYKDEDTGLLTPHLPIQRLPADGRHRLVDRSIPEWGTYTWSLRGMDLWGRFSPEASVTATVRDMIPPPAPASLDLRLSGPATAAPAWTGMTLSFDWTAQLELITPDLDRFEVHLVQRSVDRADEANPATWGRFEHLPGATAAPVVVRWPSLDVEGLPPGMTGSVTATPIAAEEGGGRRLAVEIGPVTVPFAGDVALVSATVQAVDTFTNLSPFAAHAETRRFDETPPVVPVMPGDVRLASQPDSQGRAELKIEWPNLAAGQVRVMRGAGSALLAAAGVDVEAYAEMDRTERAQTLRSAALGHREVFVADHENPYPGGAGSHTAYLKAGETGLTVFTVAATSAAGVPAPWPTSGSAFMVAAVPVTRLPDPPLLTEARSGDRQVTIRVAPDPSGEAGLVRLYRSRDTAALGDVRTMRLVSEIPAPPGGQELQVEDHEVFPDVDYWYRAVAVGASGASAPSAAVLARPYTTEPPQAPVVAEALRLPTGQVAVRARVARRDLPLFLLRRATGTVGWKPAFGAGIGSDGRLDMSVLDTQPSGDGYEVVVWDQASAGTVFRYLIRVRDSMGRQSESNQMQETT